MPTGKRRNVTHKGKRFHKIGRVLLTDAEYGRANERYDKWKNPPKKKKTKKKKRKKKRK